MLNRIFHVIKVALRQCSIARRNAKVHAIKGAVSTSDYSHQDQPVLNEIRPNQNLVMTANMHNLFNLSGCDPTCHCCNVPLPIGSIYKLASVTEEDICKNKTAIAVSTLYKIEYLFKSEHPHEIMLCDSEFCSPNIMITREIYTALHKTNSIQKEIVSALQKHTPAQPTNARIKGRGCSIVNGKIVH